MNVPVWHEPRETAPFITRLLAIKGIPFKEEHSTTIPNHTCFLVSPENKWKAAMLITKECGRFSKELQDIKLTRKEQAKVDAINNAQLAKEAEFKKRKEEEAAFVARIVQQIQETEQEDIKEEESESIDNYIEKEENEYAEV